MTAEVLDMCCGARMFYADREAPIKNARNTTIRH